MDEFALQELHRLQEEQVIQQQDRRVGNAGDDAPLMESKINALRRRPSLFQ